MDLDYVDTPQELKKGAGEELLFFLDQQGKPVTEQSVLEAAQMEPGLSQEAFSSPQEKGQALAHLSSC